uniref:Uncharacterized protein n=1 Tax=Panagrolaimus sp. ES5 TaxID=591445 RepID=A0AC34GTC2_9BILA
MMDNYFWLSIDNDDEEFMALVNGTGVRIEVIVVSCKTQEINRQLSLKNCNSKTFVEKIRFLFKDSFKTVILNLFDLDAHAYFSSNLEFREAVREEFKAINVHHVFLSADIITFSTSLIAANINVKKGETVLILQSPPLSNVLASELTLTGSGYHISNRREIIADNLTADGIVGNLNPKGIISCYSLPPTVPVTNGLLKNKNFFEFKQINDIHVPKFLVEWTKWLMNKNCKKYFVMPHCTAHYCVSLLSNEKMYSLLHVKCKDDVPTSKTKEISKLYTKVYLAHAANNQKEFALEEKCHRNKITLMVDDESFPTCKIEPIMLPMVQQLPQKLDKIVRKKIPVVGFFDQTSVICIAENNKSNYNFLEAWNGSNLVKILGEFGNEVVISFDKDEPTYCKDAMEAFSTKPTFCVHDLISIISMPPEADKIQSSVLWNFKIVKDEENPVLLKFRTLHEDGQNRAASPAFLLALILKQHVKAIRVETGVKPEALGFCLFLSQCDNVQKTRVQEQLEEVCRLLKIIISKSSAMSSKRRFNGEEEINQAKRARREKENSSYIPSRNHDFDRNSLLKDYGERNNNLTATFDGRESLTNHHHQNIQKPKTIVNGEIKGNVIKREVVGGSESSSTVKPSSKPAEKLPVKLDLTQKLSNFEKLSLDDIQNMEIRKLLKILSETILPTKSYVEKFPPLHTEADLQNNFSREIEYYNVYTTSFRVVVKVENDIKSYVDRYNNAKGNPEKQKVSYFISDELEQKIKNYVLQFYHDPNYHEKRRSVANMIVALKLLRRQQSDYVKLHPFVE